LPAGITGVEQDHDKHRYIRRKEGNQCQKGLG
jgi:hypothetical protein